jgi:hypothetical protein
MAQPLSLMGHLRPSQLLPVRTNVRYAPNSDPFLRRSEITRCANRDISLRRSK